ncbi:MAG: hypothetical protein SAL07_07870 [Oscillatoria sp. PMC 1051.18]|nr:hypothetical protein [Oscillatoria sp. PMC 1050.18]MEC5029814.1 hypothetical protein [Oscillatoria sp. PMC 1051.18]
MFKRLFCLGWCYTKPLLLISLTGFVLTYSRAAIAETEQLSITGANAVRASSQLPLSQSSDSDADMTQPVVQIDPLDSPHPVPWSWVLQTYQDIIENGGSGFRYYRSPSLISPDGQYAAYSRIQMQPEAELYQSRVTSVMFLENLRNGNLRTITASSPLADNPFDDNEEAEMPGTISILIPVSWSEDGSRLLARQFEGIFSTSVASDYAVIWNRQENEINTVAPNPVKYTNAVLLGWSQTSPEQVLFRAGNLGDENWSTWAVDSQGTTVLVGEDRPIIYGQTINQAWTGPQAKW